MLHNVGPAWCHLKTNQYSILYVKTYVFATLLVLNFKMCLLADEFKAATSAVTQGELIWGDRQRWGVQVELQGDEAENKGTARG